MDSLTERVLGHIRRDELLRAGDRVGVAVSGGIDSVALLRLLLELRGELGIVLSVVHFNHKLRGAESDADEQFVAGLAREFDLEFLSDGDDVAEHARDEGLSLEAAARELRYGFFRYLLGEGGGPQGLKPGSTAGLNGMAEAVPHPILYDAQGLKPGSLSGVGDTTEGAAEKLSTMPPAAKAATENGPVNAALEALRHPESSSSATAKAAPVPGSLSGLLDKLRAGPKGPLFRYPAHGAAESRALSNPTSGLSNPSSEVSNPTSGLSNPTSASLNKIVTGHTLDDQAETVLMRMIRGAGLRGVGGIYPRIPVEDDDGEICGEIVRPLLGCRRRELEQYLINVGQQWREDATNADEKFTRNRVRKLVVPLLEKEFNPAVAENLSELAELARGEEDYWENEVAGWMGTAVHWSEPEWARAGSNAAGLVQIGRLATGAGKIPTLAANGAARMGHSAYLQEKIRNSPWAVMNASVDLLWFLGEPLAVQRRLVKAIGEQAGIPLEFKHVEEILRFAVEAHGSGKELSLRLGWKLERKPGELIFVTPDLREQVAPEEYEYELTVPGRVAVNEISSSIEARRVPVGEEAGYNPEHLLDAESVAGPLRVRNWRPGDRYWPAHTKSPKKIKELLQERHVAQPERKLWPVVASGNEIVWLRGFPLPANVQAKRGQDAIVIVESSLTGSSDLR